MSKPRSRYITKPDSEFRQVKGFTTAIHFGKQAKHLKGQHGFDPTKSPITIGIQRLQDLVEHKAGKGKWHEPNKEVVDFGEVIGQWRLNPHSPWKPTKIGTLHYSKSGVHVVPAKPR